MRLNEQQRKDLRESRYDEIFLSEEPKKLEKEFADFLGAKYALAAVNVTAAIYREEEKGVPITRDIFSRVINFPTFPGNYCIRLVDQYVKAFRKVVTTFEQK